MFAYCVFCRSGFERKAAEEINRIYGERGVTAMAPVRVLKERRSGSVREVARPFLSGYVFVFGRARIEPACFGAIRDVIRVLRYPGGGCELSGQDLAYADFIFGNNGVIGISDILCEGGEVKVLSGPLEAYRGTIVKLDKRKQRVLLRIGIGGIDREISLGVNILAAV